MIENRGGAAGNLGARAVATAKPDGHTVLVSTTAMAINGTLYKNMGYRTEDITPVAIVGSAPEAIVVNPANPAKNLREFIDAARQKPVEYGSAGVGSGSFIAAEYLFKVRGQGADRARAVPGRRACRYRAARQPRPGRRRDGVAAGDAHPVRTSCAASASRVRSGIRSCLTSPTYAENGIADFYAASWVGFFVPSQTDAKVVARLNGALNEIVKEAAVQERLNRFALEPMYGNPAETAAFFKSEIRALGQDGHDARNVHRQVRRRAPAGSHPGADLCRPTSRYSSGFNDRRACRHSCQA